MECITGRGNITISDDEHIGEQQISSDIGFIASDHHEPLPEVEDVEKTKMERDAQKSIDYANIKGELQEDSDKQRGVVYADARFPPGLVVSISEVCGSALRCPQFRYDEDESRITAVTISMWFPYLNQKYYYTITSILILVNKLITCRNRVIGMFRKPGQGVGVQNNANQAR